MTAPSISPEPAEHREIDPGAVRMHGAVAGLVGAGVLAVWFLVVDALAGRPFFTPTLLARYVLGGDPHAVAAGPEEASIALTALFTVVHALAFAAIGVTVAEFLHRFDLLRSRALTLVLLFGALAVAFLFFALVFPAVGSDGITLRDAFIGNVLAGLGMAGYLAYALGTLPRA